MSIDSMLNKGEAAFAEGKMELAIHCFLSALELEEGNKIALNNLGVCFYSGKEYVRAFECFCQALKVDPGYKDAILNFQDAMNEFVSAAGLTPEGNSLCNDDENSVGKKQHPDQHPGMIKDPFIPDWQGKLKIGKNSVVSPHAIIEEPEKIVIGDNVQIKPGVVLRPETGFIYIGNNVVINHYTVIHGKGGVEIGDWTIIAPHCGLFAQNHSVDSFDMPITKQPNVGKGITLMGDNWLGANCTILDGVALGKGTVVGAGALVTKSFPMGVIVGGNPARFLKCRVASDGWAFELEERASVEKTPEKYWNYIDSRAVFAKKFLSGNDVVVDLGCGEGYIANILKPDCQKIIGVDYSQEALKVAREKYGLEVLQSSCDHIDFPAESFDKVIFFEIMEHLTIVQAKRSIDKIHRILKPGGMVIGSTPIRIDALSSPNTYSHIYEYSEPELRAMFKGFRAIKLDGTFFVAEK